MPRQLQMQVTAFTRSLNPHIFLYKVAGELMRRLTLMLPMIAAPAVSDSNWKELVLESSVPVIVDFWAPWCGPCRMIAPLIDELAVEYGDKIKAVRLLAACVTSQAHLFCWRMKARLAR